MSFKHTWKRFKILFHYGSRLFFSFTSFIDPSCPFTAQSKSVLIILEHYANRRKASISNSYKSRNKRNNPKLFVTGFFVKLKETRSPSKALKRTRYRYLNFWILLTRKTGTVMATSPIAEEYDGYMLPITFFLGTKLDSIHCHCT
jgi:hypothetical protein